MNKCKRIVVLYDPPPPSGGVRILAQNTFQELTKLKGASYVPILFTDKQKSIFKSLTAYVKEIRLSHAVLFQIGNLFAAFQKRSLLYLLLAFLYRKPIIYRGFAGGLNQLSLNLSCHKRLLLKLLLRVFSCVTFETKEDYFYFSQTYPWKNCHYEWLPNTRCRSAFRTSETRLVAQRFCFVGKVCRAKGIHLIVELADRLYPDVSIDIYGSFLPYDAKDIGFERVFDNPNVSYQGEISPENVQEVLKQYDCLLLPTTWKTEGYPGVILEAFSIGLPVIATAWNGIPDLVDDTCGILIEPNSADSLLQALMRMHDDRANWQAMKKVAYARMQQFQPEYWAGELHRWILAAAQGELDSADQRNHQISDE